MYSTGKALVVDFCRQVDPEAMKRFLRQWGWTEKAGVDQSQVFLFTARSDGSCRLVKKEKNG